MLIKQDFWFNSLGANRPLHIRIPDHGEQIRFSEEAHQSDKKGNAKGISSGGI